ncbi:MAG: hypothetical protein ACR2RB_07210 [Gammaproteobacteria bacterium]
MAVSINRQDEARQDGLEKLVRDLRAGTRPREAVLHELNRMLALRGLSASELGETLTHDEVIELAELTGEAGKTAGVETEDPAVTGRPATKTSDDQSRGSATGELRQVLHGFRHDELLLSQALAKVDRIVSDTQVAAADLLEAFNDDDAREPLPTQAFVAFERRLTACAAEVERDDTVYAGASSSASAHTRSYARAAFASLSGLLVVVGLVWSLYHTPGNREPIAAAPTPIAGAREPLVAGEPHVVVDAFEVEDQQSSVEALPVEPEDRVELHNPIDVGSGIDRSNVSMIEGTGQVLDPRPGGAETALWIQQAALDTPEPTHPEPDEEITSDPRTPAEVGVEDVEVASRDSRADALTSEESTTPAPVYDVEQAGEHIALKESPHSPGEPKPSFETAPTPAAADTPSDEGEPAQLMLAGLAVLAKQQIAEQRYTQPEGDSALETYRVMLALDPENQTARSGMEMIKNRLMDRANAAVSAGDLRQARQYLETALTIAPEDEALQASLTQVQAAQKADQ